MISLGIAVLSNLVMTFIMKYSESHSVNRYGITVFNYLAGTIMGYFMMGDRTLIISSGDGLFTLAFAFGNAILFVSTLLFIQASINRNGAPLTSTFNRMGILIPTVASAFLFSEIPSAVQTVGIGLAVFAIIYINGGQGANENKSDRNNFTLIGAFILGGCVDLMSKAFDELGSASYRERYVFYTFLFSLFIAICVALKENRKVTWREWIIGIMIGIPNQLTTLFLLKALGELPAYLVYPCYSAGVILMVNLINVILFREILSKREYIATGIIAAGLVLINI